MIWKRSVLGAAALLVLVTTTGCGTIARYTEKLSHIGRKKPKAENITPEEIVLGVIEIVNPEQHFVLIRTETNFNVSSGTVLETRPVSGTKTKLVASPEKKSNFVSADIAEGYPQQGETVVIVSTQPTAAPTVAETKVDTPKTLPKPASQAPPGEPVPGVPPINR